MQSPKHFFDMLLIVFSVVIVCYLASNSVGNGLRRSCSGYSCQGSYFSGYFNGIVCAMAALVVVDFCH